MEKAESSSLLPGLRQQQDARTATSSTNIMDGKEPVVEDSVQIESDGWTGRSASCRTILKQNAVLFLTMVGVVVGFALGFGLRELKPSSDALMWIGMPGELFLRMLYLTIVPVVIGNVISGTATLDPKSNGKIGLVALIWLFGTNILGCLFGVFLTTTIRPGEGSGVTDTSDVSSAFETQDIFADLFRNLIPNNIVEVGFRKAVTQYKESSEEVSRNLTNGTIVTETIVEHSKSNGKANSVNVLGLVTICMIIGIAANRLGKRADIFIRFFSQLTDIVLLILKWFFWTSPVGVASLIAKAIAGIKDLEGSFSKLGMFVMMVVVGVLVFQLIVLSLLLAVIGKRNPFYFHWNILRPYFISFASASAAVAIPEMLYCCEVKNHIDKRVARFAVPFGVTLGASGSAIFIVSSAIFIAQYIGRDLSVSDLFIIAFLTAVSALALPSVPSASLVTLVIILAALNLPSSTIALLFAVEWFLDRLRTGCNCVGQCYSAAITYRFCQSGLSSQDTDSYSQTQTPDQNDLGKENGNTLPAASNSPETMMTHI